MENFIVSARKYRPADFSAVVGQESITTTLENAIKNNHLAQAFLFCGPRGVGKTTCARILARIINEQNTTENTEEQDFAFNIFELDAASNNSVDDIRSLTDQVRIPPQVGTHKVYIIDEVHMLSQAAFNAFLKTLEEPPAHAIFILATTEKHKIIPTILSRCQIFDFNRIQVQDIANHLQEIATKESITAEPDALHIIAQKADGSLRDALSIFDQIVSFAGNNITYKAVIENLNILDYDCYFKISDFFLQGDVSNSFLLLDEILNNGFDGHNFVSGLAEHFRNLLICKDEATLTLLEVSNNVKARYQEQSQACEKQFLLQGLNVLNECDVQYKLSKNKRLRVELGLLKLCSLVSEPEKKNSEQPIKLRKPQDLKSKQPESVESEAPSEQKKESHIAEKVVVEKTEEHQIKEAQPEDSAKKEEPVAESANSIPSIKEYTASIEPTEKVDEPKEEIKKVTLQVKTEGLDVNEQREDKSQPSTPANSTHSTPSHKAQTVSITDMLQQGTGEEKTNKSEEQDSQTPEEVVSNQFSYDDLSDAWSGYAKTIEDNQPSLYKVLLGNPPALNNETEIEFTVKNVVEEDMFNETKQDLLGYLKEKLNNNQLQLATILQKEEHKGRQLYTSRDKYLYLLDKNPNLKKLKERMDLDIDF